MEARSLLGAFSGLSARAGGACWRCSIRANSHKRPQSRPMASIAPIREAALPRGIYVDSHISPNLIPSTIPPHIQVPEVFATVYNFPKLEPLRFTPYPWHHLSLPLRRDLLYRAVVFEADAARQGTASTKWRREVHGSTRKLHPQKGTGMARVGDKKSPIRRGGGVAFGPKPRDFSTDLPRKMYDKALRTALSHRYQKGELVVVDNAMEIEERAPVNLMQKILYANHLGNSLLVTYDTRPNMEENLRLDTSASRGLALTKDDVTVKAVLTMARVVIEKEALDKIFEDHQSDL